MATEKRKGLVNPDVAASRVATEYKMLGLTPQAFEEQYGRRTLLAALFGAPTPRSTAAAFRENARVALQKSQKTARARRPR